MTGRRRRRAPRYASRAAALLVAVAGLAACAGAPLPEARPASDRQASGTFEVEVEPAGAEEADGVTLGRAELRKRFHGDLEGTARGEMLTTVTSEQGSAGYVAQERVEGLLAGRRGSFVLQHGGLMDRGAQELRIVVVPGSGTGELSGIAGHMTLELGGETRRYTLYYTLP